MSTPMAEAFPVGEILADGRGGGGEGRGRGEKGGEKRGEVPRA